MDAAQYINQTSGEVEYYTPMTIIEAARCTMGSIDLDPASSMIANITVQASVYYDQNFDGLAWDWFGNVWMNHPFGRDTNERWIKKLVSEYRLGNVMQACCITYACTSEAWFKPLYQFPMCFLSPRTNYRLPDGTLKKGVTKGSVVAYLGQFAADFAHNFDKLGHIMLPRRSNQ